MTLVFLLWACFLWVLPNSRKWCLVMSPFYTLYAAGLLILQYLTGFKIGFDQLNFAYDRGTMEQIGVKIEDYQPEFVPLLVKVKWMTLRKKNLFIFCLCFLKVTLHDVLLVNFASIHKRTCKCRCSANFRFDHFFCFCSNHNEFISNFSSHRNERVR